MSSPAVNDAGQLLERFDLRTIDVLDDAREERLRYSLLRLTLAGLSREEVVALAEIGERVFAGADAAEAAERLCSRPGTSPLAVAIATIVKRGANHPVDARLTLLGAVLGAHVGTLADDPAARSSVALIGALGGGAAGPCVPIALETAERVGTSYTRTEQ